MKKTVQWKAVVGVTLAILIGSTVLAAPAMGPKQYWEKGTGYAENKLYIDAVQSFTQAIRTNKGEIGMEDVARIFNSRGLAYLALKDEDQAISDFGNAIELDGQNQDALINRGNAFLARTQFAQAQQDFGRAIALNPKSVAAYAGRGKAYEGAGSHDLALADLAKLLELEPRNIAALYNMGLVYKNKRQDDKAIETFDKLLKIDPRYAAASCQNAGLFARAGKIDSACVWLEEAVANGYRDWDALKNDADFDLIRKTDCYRKIMKGK